MPKPKKVSLAPAFTALQEVRDAYNERRDCSVKCVALACDVAYGIARDALAKAGRQTSRGARTSQVEAAFDSLGYRLEPVDPSFFLSRYPNGGKGFKNVTTHHPDRFPKVWRDGHTYVMVTCSEGHILTIKNGENLDWTRGTAKRANAIWRVVKK